MLYGMAGHLVYKKLGSTIHRYRRQNSLSQEEIAYMCHVDRTYYGKLEQGKANPTLRILIKISRALKIQISQLVEGLG